MAEGDKYLDYPEQTLEWMAKLLSTFVSGRCIMKWQLSHSPFEQQLEAITFTKTPGGQQSAKSLPATKNMPMSTTGT